MKHIALDFNFVQEHVEEGKLQVLHIPNTRQLADILTKPLRIVPFLLLWKKSTSTLDEFEGHVGD